MKTRSRKSTTKSGDKGTTEPAPTIQKLQPSVSNPSQVFILPKNTSESARVVTLPNPATSAPNRYLLCPEKGFYEFTRVAAPKKACKSWLLAADQSCAETKASSQDEGEGYVLQSPDLMVATQIDPLFLILQALSGDETSGRQEQEYLSPSDYLERLAETSSHFSQILQSDARTKIETLFEGRIQAVCDMMDAGDERLYSLSKKNLLAVLAEKAKRMVQKGLPASMEERFVKRELAVPVLSVKREESSMSLTEPEDAASGGAESQATSQETVQDTQSSVATSQGASTAATSFTSTPGDEKSYQPTAQAELERLLHLRTALNFLLHAYISPTLRSQLQSLLAISQHIIDFSPLDKHMDHIAALKKEAQALRSMSDNISRKRSALEDDDALEKAEAKKRKKEEEEVKKKNQSRGVQQLKKADTSGMKKLSSFFTAKPAAKKG